MSDSAYRNDIDGLRAIAVLAVMAFHSGIRLFSGGFVGVDVFFVISGYLIGTHLLNEMDSGSFSAAEFYKRRILRIAPASFAVLLVLAFTLPFILFPQQISYFVASLRTVLISGSNFYFASQSGYFSDPFSKPLLHTWSLAVEEQFYLAFPIVLLLVRSMSKRVRLVALLAMFFASATLSAWAVRTNPNMAFYSPLSRSWELLLGTLLFYLPGASERLAGWIQEVLSVLGLLLVLGTIHFYTSKTLFPGPSAAAPCIGAALLILFAGRRGSVVNRLLCWRPIAFLGLISYSLYLWHWPVTVLTRMEILTVLPYDHRSQTIFIFLASILLAVFSWWFIERPFRTTSMRSLPPTKVFSGFVTACVGIFAVSAVVNRIPSPYPVEAQAMSQYINQVDNEGYRKGSCYVGDPYSFHDFRVGECLTPDARRPNVLVLGDSHAAAIYPGLSQVFPEVHFLQATAQGCKPLKDVAYSADCDALMRSIFYNFLPHNRIDAILLIGRWLDKSDFPEIDRTITYLRTLGQNPILVGPALEYRISLPMLLAYSISRHDPSLPARYQDNDLFTLDDLFQEHAASERIPYFSQLQLLCKEKRCVQSINLSPEVPVLFDSNHFTVQGSVLLAERLRQDKGTEFFTNAH